MKSLSDARHDLFLLSTSPPTSNQVRLAACLLGVLIGAFLVVLPFARQPLVGTASLVVAYAAAIMVLEVITAALLMALFSVHGSWAILVLAAGYMFSGLMVVPWALTFPGAFATLDFSAGLQSTASIATLRRLGFPLFVLAYALLKSRDPFTLDAPESVRSTVTASIIGTATLVCGATWFIVARGDLLPQMMTAL